MPPESDDRIVVVLLTELLNNSKTQSTQLGEMNERLIRLEVKQEGVETLRDEFDTYKREMQPFRDDMVGIKKVSSIAMWMGGGIPALIAALVYMWHPWTDDTRQQLLPVMDKIDKLTADSLTNTIHVTSVEHSVNNINDELSSLQVPKEASNDNKHK